MCAREEEDGRRYPLGGSPLPLPRRKSGSRQRGTPPPPHNPPLPRRAQGPVGTTPAFPRHRQGMSRKRREKREANRRETGAVGARGWSRAQRGEASWGPAMMSAVAHTSNRSQMLASHSSDAVQLMKRSQVCFAPGKMKLLMECLAGKRMALLVVSKLGQRRTRRVASSRGHWVT